MKVECDSEEVDLENEKGVFVPGVMVTCSRCDHTEESFGVSEKSVKRCLALLRDNCPNNEDNYYAVD